MNDNVTYQIEKDDRSTGLPNQPAYIAMKVTVFYQNMTRYLEQFASQLPPFLFRMILAYEFWEAGIMKYEGENWFSDLVFPFPFNLFSSDTLWSMATWFELIGAIALVLGIATRFVSLALLVLTVVAIQVAHWPSNWDNLTELWQGYAIIDQGHGNFKLPLLFLLMFLTLLINGAGKWSLDTAIKNYLLIK